MKLGTVQDGSRDGMLMVVDARGETAVSACSVSPNLQHALDNWDSVEGALRDMAQRLEHGNCRDARPVAAMTWRAPLPRAYQLLDGGGYMPHLELGYQLRRQAVPPEIATAPMFYQSVSDSLLGPCDDVALQGDELGVDFEAEIAVITTDVAQGSSMEQAVGQIRLLTLMNDISLRFVQRKEFAMGFGFFNAKPKKAFAPFAVTPDELGSLWSHAIPRLAVRVEVNGHKFAEVQSGEDVLFDFAALVSGASRHRALASGTILAGGTVSNRDRSRGQCCIYERRVLDTLATGREDTPYLSNGDRVRIEALLPGGGSVFGAMDQRYRLTT